MLWLCNSVVCDEFYTFYISMCFCVICENYSRIERILFESNKMCCKCFGTFLVK